MQNWQFGNQTWQFGVWNTKGDILNNIPISLCHTVAMKGDWGFQA